MVMEPPDTRCGFTLIKRLAMRNPSGITAQDVRALKLRYSGPESLSVLYRRGYLTRSGKRGSYRYFAVEEMCDDAV